MSSSNFTGPLGTKVKFASNTKFLENTFRNLERWNMGIDGHKYISITHFFKEYITIKKLTFRYLIDNLGYNKFMSKNESCKTEKYGHGSCCADEGQQQFTRNMVKMFYIFGIPV
jgi:hypothetical protein